MSIILKDFADVIQDITAYPSLSQNQIILAANKTLQVISDSYNWKWLNKTDSSLNTTANQDYVDISSFTDISFINNIFLDNYKYRIYYQNDKNLIDNIRLNIDGGKTTGIPTYYNDKRENGKIIFDISADTVYNIIINYKRVIRTLEFTKTDYETTDLETDTEILIPKQFKNLILNGIITNVLVPSNTVDYKVQFYSNLFMSELQQKIMNEQKENDLIMDIQATKFINDLEDYSNNL